VLDNADSAEVFVNKVTKTASQIVGLLAAGMMVAGLAHAQATRDYISIVGSSTVYPFATAVAEQFGKTSKFKTPKVESTGSGGGIKLFCGGVGVQHPDITNASRRIKATEVAECAKNGVRDIVEIKFGFDGIILANSVRGPRFDLTRRDIFLALAKNVPDPKGSETLIPNPYKKWSEVNPKLSAEVIEVLGPPPTSGTRDAFVELAMEGGCKTFPWIAALKDEAKLKVTCQTLREDGRFIEAGENDNLIVQKLKANPSAVGIFGYSYLEQNAEAIQGSKVDGQLPTFEAISSGAYPVSRPLFFYVKKAHVGVIPGMREYIAEFTSAKAMGAEGYLADKGLIPLPKKDEEVTQGTAKSLAPMGAL
jgi:phosphate transport system substrate-binding protein